MAEQGVAEEAYIGEGESGNFRARHSLVHGGTDARGECASKRRWHNGGRRPKFSGPPPLRLLRPQSPAMWMRGLKFVACSPRSEKETTTAGLEPATSRFQMELLSAFERRLRRRALYH